MALWQDCGEGGTKIQVLGQGVVEVSVKDTPVLLHKFSKTGQGHLGPSRIPEFYRLFRSWMRMSVEYVIWQFLNGSIQCLCVLLAQGQIWLHQNFLSEKWCQDFSSGLVVKESEWSMVGLVFDPGPGKNLITRGETKKKKKKRKERQRKKKNDANHSCSKY